jgi:hypothetical protein
MRMPDPYAARCLADQHQQELSLDAVRLCLVRRWPHTDYEVPVGLGASRSVRVPKTGFASRFRSRAAPE